MHLFVIISDENSMCLRNPQSTTTRNLTVDPAAQCITVAENKAPIIVMSSPSDVASPSTGGTTTAGPQTTADPCCNILILGASYGSLLACKFVLAGHACTLVCRAATAKVFNERGSVVRMPVRGREGLIDVVVPPGGRLTACTPDEVAMEGTSPAYDLVVLAMQEPQYSAPDVRTLVLRVAASGCL